VHVRAFAEAKPLPGYPRAGGTLAFVGRYDEPRKGMPVLLAALPELLQRHPDLQVLVVGGGDEDALRKAAGRRVARHLRLFGRVDDAKKASVLRSADVYCAPNTGGESFGIVLVEAMSAGTAVAASDLDAFRRVLDGGAAGRLVPTGDVTAWTQQLDVLLSNAGGRAELAVHGRRVVAEYDWLVVAQQVMQVYETVTAGREHVHEADR